MMIVPDNITESRPRTGVVIPCFRVKQHILSVIDAVGADVWRIYVVDDKCPEGTGDFVTANCDDARVIVLRNDINLGVGGAMVTGFRRALADGCDIVVKVDGDGQMNPAFIPALIRPIVTGAADYAKGNRFWNIADVRGMPAYRLLGNAVLSFMTKFSSGYWAVFDPTNGFVAIHGAVLKALPLEKINRRFFFESDMLFRLNTIRAVVADVPMMAVYRGEASNLSVMKNIGPFLWGNIRNSFKRLFYSYFLRDFSAASVEVLLGMALFIFGATFGAAGWMAAASRNEAATAGTVMLAALPIIIGLNLLLSFLHFDVQNVPRNPIHPSLLEVAKVPPETVVRIVAEKRIS